MGIAVIGWGSLIWCPGSLRIASRWHADGPPLPIEFARISGDGRLTLVIHTGTDKEPTPVQQTYWALSEFKDKDLEAARENLHVREGTNSTQPICSLTSDGKVQGGTDQEVVAQIREWLLAQHGMQVAIWTGLESNWQKKRQKTFTVEDAVAYLGELENNKQAKATYDRAREYICNTPSQIQTPVRKIMQQKGWRNANLPTVLFE